MASSISPLFAKDLSEIFFVILDTRIVSSIPSPQGVLLFLLESPVFARPDSEYSHISKQSSCSRRCWPQYGWCPAHSVSPGHLNGTTLWGFNYFSCSETPSGTVCKTVWVMVAVLSLAFYPHYLMCVHSVSSTSSRVTLWKHFNHYSDFVLY